MPRQLFRPRPHLIKEGKNDAACFKTFLRLVKTHGRPATYRDYERVLRWFQEFLLQQDLTLKTVRTEDIDQFLSKWQGRTSQYVYSNIIHRFLNFLGLISAEAGVQVDVPPPKRNRVEEIRRQLISQEEFEAFLSLCYAQADLHAALMASILYETGLRVHELVQLCWKHLDSEEGILEVPKRKSGHSHSVPFGVYTQTHLRLLEPSGHLPDEPIIPSRSRRAFGKSQTTNGIRFLIAQYGERAGWRQEQLHPHAFRHSFATNLVRRGVPLPVVQELMDHSDIKHTMVYVHLGKADVLDAYRRIMRPDWKTPIEEGPLRPDTCPDCNLVRLPGYKRCPACGFDFAQDPALTRKKRLLAMVLQDPEVESILEEKLRDLIPQEKET